MEPVHQPLRVMRIEKIEQYIVILLHIHSITAVDHVLKLFFIHRSVQKEVVNTAHQRIIHDRVILVSCQPLAGIMPDLSQQIDIRFDLFQMCPHLSSKTGVTLHFPRRNG